MYGGSFVGMTQWHTAAQRPPHLAAIAPYVPIYPGWDIPNTNGIPQAWTAVSSDTPPGRALNPAFIEAEPTTGPARCSSSTLRSGRSGSWTPPSGSPPMTGG